VLEDRRLSGVKSASIATVRTCGVAYAKVSERPGHAWPQTKIVEKNVELFDRLSLIRKWKNVSLATLQKNL